MKGHVLGDHWEGWTRVVWTHKKGSLGWVSWGFEEQEQGASVCPRLKDDRLRGFSVIPLSLMQDLRLNWLWNGINVTSMAAEFICRGGLARFEWNVSTYARACTRTFVKKESFISLPLQAQIEYKRSYCSLRNSRQKDNKLFSFIAFNLILGGS